MLRDGIIMNIQIALIGIVLVLSIFYFWRQIQNLEDRMCRCMQGIQGMQGLSGPSALEVVMNRSQPNQPSGPAGSSGHSGPMGEADTTPLSTAEQYMMDHIFGATTLSPMPPMPTVNVSEIPDEAVDAVEEALSEAPSHLEPLSKSKVRKMAVEGLREVCKERNISAEGPRNALVERVLESL